MLRYIFCRIASAVPVLIGISLLAFILGVLAPGDPAEFALNQNGLGDPSEAQILQMRKELGLDLPLWQQYLHWISNVLTGDLGKSYITGRSIADEILLRLPITAELALMALVMIVIFGITGGTICAVYQNSFFDNAIKNLTNIILSVPSFWLALLSVLLFSEILQLLPTSGSDGIVNFILPAVTVSFSTAATVCRYMRGALINEFEKQYFIVASARGIAKFKLIACYALPNAILPVIALLGNYFANILGGSVIAESIFALPGISSMALDAIRFRDYPVLQAYVLVNGWILIVVTVAVDIFMARLNPKVKFEK